ncbi:hypothetical protein BKA70DRAFT_1563044 [Coprinopsis sp. MPI-PUGE-AT-0042]|nr:hypothetical protein BKA70DRAFT_1563044 [Coprinopsis sp. MPI-PUGE-AT-0042]
MASESHPPSDKEMNTYGAMFAASTFGISILSGGLLVVQIVLVLYGLSGFFTTPKDRRKGRLRFIIISAVMLVMSAIDISFDLWKFFLFLYTGGPDGVSYLRAIVAIDENYRWEPIGDAFFLAAVALGDILMLWRCLILWTERKWVVLFPSLVCVCSIATRITYLVGDVTSAVGIRAKVLLAGDILHVAMNITITFLIVLRVMGARSRAAKAFPDQKPPRWYSEVTALVVESAAPLAIFGACSIVLRGAMLTQPARQLQSGQVLQRARRNIFSDVVHCLYSAFCTLSPQMIIVRVTRGKAWKHSMVEATENGANFLPANPICTLRKGDDSLEYLR